LAQLIRLMRDSEARAVIRQPHEPAKNATFVADKAGAAVVVLAGSVGALPAAADYLSLFDGNIAALSAVQPPCAARAPSVGRRSWWRCASSASTPISASRCWPER